MKNEKQEMKNGEGRPSLHFSFFISCFSFFISLSASVAAQPAPSTTPAPSASPSEKTTTSCTEYIPDGAGKPKIETHFPPSGLSGYELRLLVIVTHGRGETVLPAGFHLDRGSDAIRALADAKFHIPEVDGGS